MKVVLIDDDLRSLKGLETSLKVVGKHECTSFNDPLEALQSFDEHSYDVVITDIRMPYLNGVDVLKAVKSANPDIFVVMITGHDDMNPAVESVNLRADAFFTKPIQVKPLLSTLETFSEAIKEKEKLVNNNKCFQKQLEDAESSLVLKKAACGIMHDFNNLLTVIDGQTFFVQEEIKNIKPEISESLDEILKTTDRAANLTRYFLRLCNNYTNNPIKVDYNKYIEDFKSIIIHLLGKHVKLDINISTNIGEVYIIPSLYGQIMLNLVSNARDAMINGGNLTISAEIIKIESVISTAICELPMGTYLKTKVRDTGMGMSKEVRSKIFNPFFTTKESGKGTGIGLYTVSQIVKEMNGGIEVTSELGEGTTFEVFIPYRED